MKMKETQQMTLTAQPFPPCITVWERTGQSPLLLATANSTSRFEYVNNPASKRNTHLPTMYLISSCYALPHAVVHLCKSSIIIVESVTQCTPCHMDLYQIHTNTVMPILQLDCFYGYDRYITAFP